MRSRQTDGGTEGETGREEDENAETNSDAGDGNSGDSKSEIRGDCGYALLGAGLGGGVGDAGPGEYDPKLWVLRAVQETPREVEERVCLLVVPEGE